MHAAHAARGSERTPVAKNRRLLANTFRGAAAGTRMFNLSTKGRVPGLYRTRIDLGNGGELYQESTLR